MARLAFAVRFTVEYAFDAQERTAGGIHDEKDKRYFL